MLSVGEMINRTRKTTTRIDAQELKELPYKNAYIYGRLSTPSQVRDSKESIREIAYLVKLAIEDGYVTGLVPSQVEAWLEDVSAGRTVERVLADGQVTVDVQDLGLSGQLSAESRKGMTALQKGIADGITGGVYVTEGVSRLSRDKDRILPYQLLKLMKDHKVRLRTPEGVWNPAIERDFDYLAEEFDQAIGELKVMNKRMFRRKAQKAARGEFVGEPVPLGFIVPVIGRKPNGLYEYGKYEPYPPHAEIAEHILQVYVRCQGSLIKSMEALKDIVIPFFPADLGYMERLSSLRKCRRLSDGYEISPTLVFNLAKNLKMIGIWTWGNNEPLLDNHPAIISKELFGEAFEMASSGDKPKGKTVSFEPLEWSGLLYCLNHEKTRQIVSRKARGVYSCDRDYKYARGPTCLYIIAHLLDRPLSHAVLSQLELSPIIEDVIEKLKNETLKDRLDNVRSRQQSIQLEKEIRQFQALLPGCVDEFTGAVDRQKEKYYWDKIREAEKQLIELKNKLFVPDQAAPDYTKVRDFLKRLPQEWPNYSRPLRNRFLKALIDRVELRGNRDIEAIVYWKAGFRQRVVIKRKNLKSLSERLWTTSEVEILRDLYPAAKREIVLSALPARNWNSIALKANRLRIKRHKEICPYTKLIDATITQADEQKHSDFDPNKSEVTKQSQNLIVHQQSSSGGLRGL